ncbi:MAG: hydantoinase B/oxoprolinase family protein [Candidatus Methylomirabilota bacterium]
MSDDVRPGLLLDVRAQMEEAACAMDATLRQGASSAAIGRHGASAAGFYGPTGSLIIGGRESHPLLLEVASEALAVLVRQEAAAGRSFEPRALYWTNDAGCGAAGIEELLLAVPVVRDGRAVCFVAVTATHPALGRATLAPAESLRQEGLVLPWTRVSRVGGIRGELLDLLAANSEEPTGLLEDVRAQVHSLLMGEGIVQRLVDSQGPADLTQVWDALGTGCRRGLQGILAKLEEGAVEGRVSPFTVRIRATGDRAVVSVQTENNTVEPPPTPALARAAVRSALREILAAEVRTTSVLGGWADAVQVEVPWGAPPANLPMGVARYIGAQALADAVLAAFAERVPHLAHAPDTGPVLVDLRGVRVDGSRYRMRLELGGGSGASVYGDGMTHGAPAFQPLCLRPAESIERAVPVRVVRCEMRPDSAGPGQYRGGLGAAMELELLEGRAEVDVLLPGRPPGLRGGMRAAGARVVLLTPEEGMQERTGPGRVTLRLRPGHRVILESPGGGGWALPFQRSIMRVEEDLRRSLISRDQSRSRYGVVLKPGPQEGGLEKDDHLTYRVRHYLLSTLAVEDIIAGEELLD